MVTLDLPLPPSANSIWRQRKGRYYLAPEYQAWKTEAGKHIVEQRCGAIMGPFRLTAMFTAARKGTDLDNKIKPLLDLLQQQRVIENDNLAQEITLRWGPTKYGCHVEIFEAAA